MILDQRHMSGPDHLRSREDVVAFWDEFAREKVRRGKPPFPLAPGRTERTHSRQHIAARINESRWVADCLGGPNGDCRGGIACWPEHEKACCLDCGTVYTVDFPEPHIVEEAVKALLVRPPGNRHWQPDEETPEQLREENAAHGVA